MYQHSQLNKLALDQVCTELELSDIRLHRIREDGGNTQEVWIKKETGTNGYWSHGFELVEEMGMVPVGAPSEIENQGLGEMFTSKRKKKVWGIEWYSLSNKPYMGDETYFSNVSWPSWQSTQAEIYSRILKTWLAPGSLMDWREWLRPQNAGCTVPLHFSTAADQAHTRSRSHRMSRFWFRLLTLSKKEKRASTCKESSSGKHSGGNGWLHWSGKHNTSSFSSVLEKSTMGFSSTSQRLWDLNLESGTLYRKHSFFLHWLRSSPPDKSLYFKPTVF